MARLSWISYTPVKGLRLETVDQVELTKLGIPGDRRFHLVNEQGYLTNAKRVGVLQQVRAAWNENEQRLALRFPDGSVVESEVRPGERVTTSFYGRPVDGAVVDGDFAAALSDFTGVPLRLVQPDQDGAGVDRGQAGAVTLLSEASLGRLAQAAGVPDVDARRFRMNFGIADVAAHEEDVWIGRPVRIGGVATVVPHGHVGRCLITSRQPETGVIDLDTLNALATYRRHLDTTEELAFGVFAEVQTPGPVRVGDPVVPG